MDSDFDFQQPHMDDPDAGSDFNDIFETPTYYGDLDGRSDSNDIALHPENLEAALAEAIKRSGFDPALDTLSDGYLSNIQGITAEYLVADALNHSGDGLEYALYSDPTHPEADLAGFAPDGTLIRLLQVKATSDPWYAATGIHPGVELVTTSDGFRSGMEMMDISAAQLREEIRSLLATN